MGIKTHMQVTIPMFLINSGRFATTTARTVMLAPNICSMLGSCWGYVGPMFTLYCSVLGHVGPMLGAHVGPMLGAHVGRPCWAYIGAMVGHVGPRLGHVGHVGPMLGHVETKLAT